MGDRKNVDSKGVRGNSFVERKSGYVGGDLRENIVGSPSTTFFLGFHTPGYKLDNLATVTVLEVLLGSGSQFSSGGPGKGMHSILNRKMNETGFITDMKAHNLCHDNSGLFGIEATSINNHYAEHALEVVTTTLLEILEGVSDEDLNRAKALSRINVEMGLERSSARIEDNLRNLLLYNNLEHVNYGNMINAVTKEDLSNLVGGMLSSKPTMVVSGQTQSVPS